MTSHVLRLSFVSLALMLSYGARASAQEVGNTWPDARPPLRWLQAPTMGGVQFWTDELVYYDWRIQRNFVTGHYRLLDDQNVRRAAGSFVHCRQQFERLKQQENLPPLPGRVVLVLHGLGRSRGTMEGMSEFLRSHGEWAVMNVSYASTRESIAQHAQSLATVISHLSEDVKQIDFVAHSMGNLVIRRYQNRDDADPRIGRLVMLAPPNHGAQLAERLKDNRLFTLITGDSGNSLSEDWGELAPALATPACEFGIIAGAAAEDVGGNPLIDGADDLIVAVEETRLAGACDFAVVPSIHTTLMDHPLTRQYTLRFLQEGYFVSAGQRQPIDTHETPQP